MNHKLENRYILVSPKKDIIEFIESNENAIEILNAIEPHLLKHFPNSSFSLELCDKLPWTTEEKLLVNVRVSHEMFFNGMLNHFNDIYEKISDLIEENFCPIVLFADLPNASYDRMSYNSAINLMARTAYFNSDFDKNLQREMSIREIPKKQKEREIIEYCQRHPSPDLSDVVYDLQLDLFDVDEIIDEMECKGIKLNVRY